MKATKAAVPMPAVRFSKAMTAVNTACDLPTMASAAKAKVEMACKIPNQKSAGLILILRMMAPPTRPPTVVAIQPKIFVTAAISVFVKPSSK